jgi:antitoxin ParD1/3/4
MATMNISLPDMMKKLIEQRVESGLYANASDYVRDLIRDDHADDTWVIDKLTARDIDEGEASGDSDRPIREVLANERASFLAV